MRWILLRVGATGSTSGGTKGDGASSSRGSGTDGGSALSGVGIKSSSCGELASIGPDGGIDIDIGAVAGTWIEPRSGEKVIGGCCGAALRSGCDFLGRIPVVREDAGCTGTGTRSIGRRSGTASRDAGIGGK